MLSCLSPVSLCNCRLTCGAAALLLLTLSNLAMDSTAHSSAEQPLAAISHPVSSKAIESRLAVFPAEVELSGVESRQRLLVHRRNDLGVGSQLSEGFSIESSDESIARVVRDRVIAVGPGKTEIVVTGAGETLAVPVTVHSAEPMDRTRFRHDVLPVLAKLGCNSGACHGALAGKGGFRLSLRGYDPESDHFTITRQSLGRRIDRADAARSLLLTKPSGALPHQGGLRFDVDSPSYRILSEWILAGAPGPREDDPSIAALEVFPELTNVNVGDRMKLSVRARFSDGTTQDVTEWVKWTSADESVATIDDQGSVEVIGSGEGAFTAWYSSQIAIARVTSPFPNQIDPSEYDRAPVKNFIDELSLAQLRRLQLPPSPRCDDATFIRRVYLDCIGTLPTADEVRDFVADESEGKRDRLIGELLERPEFVDYWSYKWSDVLLINGTRLRPAAVKSYYEWIRGNVERNAPWDRFARDVLTAQGQTDVNGATNFYALHQEPETMSENASQAFLGLSIACAKCHDHPLEKWTNDQYYAMASLFARVRGKGWGGDSRNGDGKRTVYVVRHGELIQPRTGRPQPPTPLDGEPVEFDDPGDRRIHLADWLTSPENPYFARSITNRVWAAYFGVGLVEPVDDMRVSNPASNDELLSAAAQYLVDQEFDLKALMQAIMRSETYQRSSMPLEANEADTRFYSHYYPRRLTAEVLLDAISQVTEVPSRFDKIQFPGADTANVDFYPEGTRAIQLYDSAVQSYFLKTFGRNTREITCECERSNEPSMVQVLHLANGTTLNEKLSRSPNRIDAMIEAEMPNERIIEDLYLTALSRRPTDDERNRLLETLEESNDEHRLEIEDLFWSVMSSREFLFAH